MVGAYTSPVAGGQVMSQENLLQVYDSPSDNTPLPTDRILRPLMKGAATNNPVPVLYSRRNANIRSSSFGKNYFNTTTSKDNFPSL